MSALAGKVAIVGGSSQGIGYAVARRLAGDGADVALVARRAAPLEAAAARIREETGRRVLAVTADIRKALDCERIIAEPLKHFGRLDILVNNDGAPPLGDLMSFDDAAWDKAWQQNFMSVVRLTRGAVPAMRAAGGGRIVNITALSVLQPMPKFGLSVATWAGVIGYAKTLSLEVAADNITVNTICPGRIDTGRIAKVFAPDSSDAAEQDAAIAKIKKEIPLGRLGEPEEVAGLIAMLASDAGGYITGATLHVDGGRRANLL
jgi:3-oxoacyl-[acyl-carrier protein] reductase